MRDVTWICVAVILLVSKVWSLDPGIQNVTFNLGSDANLTCSGKSWNETLFVIWTIQLKHRTCKITWKDGVQDKDNCSDGKPLGNKSKAQFYLSIPNFSTEDVGIYKCESVFSGGNKNDAFNVTITVPPVTSAWLEHKVKKMVAVCKAERGRPAANISWSLQGIAPFVTTHHDSDGFISVASHLELTKGVDAENLTCVIRHPYWKQDRILAPELREGYFPWLLILIGVVVLIVLVGLVFLAHKKIMTLRSCKQSEISFSKSPPTEDVEEVEPYASYVQRENSIYN
ncbi:cell surface glycoprotein CD200 receptor 1 isoform X2 [Solea senegalensis]|uniref:Cell surface glycoprotein CD200 receptor 1 isoform X2 n=1 Tax=Solea senegalensis TaxID=28829 RepID=A0AAV6RBK9_SOLSE|nr:cell surface glycoprotein CD200 receptor 1 isoform X2 [Solea senegalensis]KAG7501672.1 cell surface glycoprotein CD200 receptor 1 isoform X2 [Solea senegalensis]